MRACKHSPEHMKGKCPDMTDEEYSHYTRTPTKNLPERKARKKRPIYRGD